MRDLKKEMLKIKVKGYFDNGDLKVDPTITALVKYHVDKARHNIETGSLLMEVSEDKESKKRLKVSADYIGYDWTISCGYYAMFHAATAALAAIGIKAQSHESLIEGLEYHFVFKEKAIESEDIEKIKSAEDQAKEGYSLEVQREYLESFALREGYEVFKVYCDDGISAYSTRRPALQALLADAKAKRFELVLVHKIDRFSRNLKDLLMLVDELYSYGVAFKSATEPFDTTASAGKLMFQQLGSFAEFERNRIAKRVFPGMIKGLQRGNWQGARFAPFGYAYNKAKKLLEIEEREANIVKLIYTMYISGKSTHGIAAYLDRKGYKTRTGKQFYNKFVCDILKNQVYTGKIIWNKKHYDKNQKTKRHYKYIRNDPSKILIAQGRHKPIIDDEDFAEVQTLLANKTRTWRPRAKNKEYLLTGLITCAKCNHRYTGVSSISNHRLNKKKCWYRCSGPHSSHINCTNRAVKAEDIEPEATKIIAQLIQNERLKQPMDDRDFAKWGKFSCFC